MNNLESYCQQLEQLTKQSSSRQKSLINWFNKQNIVIKTTICTEQKNKFFKLSKSKNASKEVIPLAAFYLAINKYYQLDNLGFDKNKGTNIHSIRKVSSFLAKKYQTKKIHKKREKLLNIWSVIQYLHTESYSFRKMSEYILQHHRFSVSHTYIHNLWIELEEEQDDA